MSTYVISRILLTTGLLMLVYVLIPPRYSPLFRLKWWMWRDWERAHKRKRRTPQKPKWHDEEPPRYVP